MFAEVMTPTVTDTTFSSGVYRMGHGAFFRRIAVRHAAGWFWICSLAAVISLVMALAVDLRWLVVLFAVVCLGFPMLAVFLYFYYGLRKECFVNIVPHGLSLEAGDDELTVVIYRLDETAPAEEEKTLEEGEVEEVDSECVPEERVEEKPDKDGEDPADDRETGPVYLETGRFRFPLSELKPYEVGKNSVTLPVGRGFIWIPLSAWNNEREFADFVKALYAPTRKDIVLDNEINGT